MTGPQLDLDDQIVDEEWAKEAIGEWFKQAANIRQMHSAQLPPAGKGMEVEQKDDGFWLRSKIIEPFAIKAIEHEVYTGYSIGIKGPRIMRDAQAKNGRIVGGTIVETSVVDYPCLTSAKFVKSDDRARAAKFVLAKVADQGVQILNKIAPVEEIETTRDHLIAEDMKRDFSEGERDRAASHGQALPDGSFPIVSKEDLRNAIQAIGRAKNKGKARRHIISRARALGATDMLPDGWTKQEKLESLYVVKRAHDVMCPAYDMADVLMTYPELAKDGVARALGPGTRSQIYAMLEQEVEEDGGKGSEADEINDLAHAYKLLCEFLYGEALEVELDSAPPQAIMDALSDLHKTFESEFHPEAKFRPKASVSLPAVPGSEAGFGAGSASFSPRLMAPPAGLASVSVPGVPGSVGMPADSGSKDGGGAPSNSDSASVSVPAVPGSEAGMPADADSKEHADPDDGVTGKNNAAIAIYDAGARAQLAAAMKNLHDSLMSVPGFECPMPGVVTAKADPDMHADATPKPLTADAEPELVKSTEPEKEEKMEDPKLPVDVVTKADLEEAIQRTVKLATKAAEARHAETETSLREQIDDLHQKIEELAAEPDPRLSVVKKAVGAERPSKFNEAAEGEVSQKRTRLESDRADFRELSQSAGEWATRSHAQRQLRIIEQQLEALEG